MVVFRSQVTKNGLTVTKGKGLGRMGGKGGIRGKRSIMITTHNVVGGGHGEGSIATAMLFIVSVY